MADRKWTTGDVEDVIDSGRRVARLVLEVFAPYLALAPADKVGPFLAADEKTRAEAVAAVRARLVAEGCPGGLADVHLDGALAMIQAGHPLDAAADRSRRH